MSSLEKLKCFRETVYNNFTLRADATMNILDALSSYGHRCNHVIELSEAPCFERQYTSITDGIADGLGTCQWGKITEATNGLLPMDNDRILLVVDCTPNRRSTAKTLEDRHITHFPNPAPGNKPICIGHEYSTLAMIPPDTHSREKHWLIPLSTERVRSDQKGHEVGMEQIDNYLTQHAPEEKLVVSIADSKYGSEYCRKTVSQSKHWVHLFRLNSTRNVYSPAKQQVTTKKTGNSLRYDGTMTLNKPETHRKADETVQKTIITRSGKSCALTINVWRDQLLRGSRAFKGYEHPISVYQIVLTDEAGNPLYKNPMWLSVTGKRRNELSADDVFEYYSYRYDIEHFFRFGKDKLLMDSYQTPDMAHEASWWKLASLAYTQLYFARDAVPRLPKKWERYLPSYQNPAGQAQPIVTPSQTQRGFSTVFDQIGTPAKPCIARGNPKGRSLGEIQTKREKHPVIFKTKKPSKSDKKQPVSGSEKTSKKSDSAKIKRLIKSVRTQLENANYDVEQFYQQLLKKG